MSTDVELCNIALYRVGAEKITALSDSNKRAKICNDIYAFERDLLLREHPWNFATKRVALVITGATPVFGFTQEFTLPADYIRIIDHEYSSYDTFHYRIEGGLLLCDESTIKIEYIYKVTDTSTFDEKFTEVLALRIASRLAYALVNSNTLQERIFNEAERGLSMARLFDAQEGGSRQLMKSDWTNSRN